MTPDFTTLKREPWPAHLATVSGAAKVLDRLSIKEVMTSDVIMTSPDKPLVEAARVLAERKLGCLPVVEDGGLVGMLTEEDFVAMVARNDR